MPGRQRQKSGEVEASQHEVIETLSQKQNKGWVWWLMPVLLTTLEAKNRNYRSRPAEAKNLMRPYLNQWLGVVVCAYHPGYPGKHK
jgi:hypothetical protein